MADQETLNVLRRAPSRTSVYATWLCMALSWLSLDQLTKLWAVATLESQRAIDLVVLDLRLIRNPGGAFGIPGLFPGLFVLVTAVMVVLVLRALPRTTRLSLAFAYGLVTGGALGNVTDRIFRSPGFPSGHVVDFIDLRWFPVFNVADIGICVGAGLIALILSRVEREQQAVA